MMLSIYGVANARGKKMFHSELWLMKYILFGMMSSVVYLKVVSWGLFCLLYTLMIYQNIAGSLLVYKTLHIGLRR